MTDYTRDDLVRVRFTHVVHASIDTIIEIEPQDGESFDDTIERARDELDLDQNRASGICAQCSGYGSDHKSDGGNGKFLLDFNTDLGTEIEAEILKED